MREMGGGETDGRWNEEDKGREEEKERDKGKEGEGRGMDEAKGGRKGQRRCRVN